MGMNKTADFNKDIPIMKLFFHNNKYFVYDTYQNEIFQIERGHFLELRELTQQGVKQYLNSVSDSNFKNDIKCLINKGYFKAKIAETIEHPETQYTKELLDQCIGYLQLQVTQDCNFSCRYCSFASEVLYNRPHSKKMMTYDTAKKAIDLLYNHSSRVPEIRISFYGGEPLLNYNLIKHAVEYVEKRFCIKKIRYYITSNFSIVNTEILDFFIAHGFNLLISFDGNEEIQNSHRVFGKTGGKTFESVFKNIEFLKNYNSRFFEHNVRFNAVYFSDESVPEIYSFFDRIGVPENRISVTTADLSGIDYSRSFLKRIEKKDNETNDVLNTTKEILAKRIPIYKKWHPNGTCIPGIGRMLIDVDGCIYPCEKVIETEASCIGNLTDGLNTGRINIMQNIAKLTENECKHCWAMRFCSSCVCHCVDAERNELSNEQKKAHCNNEKLRSELSIIEFINSFSAEKLQ